VAITTAGPSPVVDTGTQGANTGRREQAILAVVSIATLIALAAYTAPAVVLPTLAADLHAGAGAQTWLLNGITFGLAVLLLTAGSIADDYGRRRVFVLGAVGLGVGLAGSALAPSAWLFVASRIVQGAASAGLLAAGLGLLADTFPAGPARTRATATWGSMIGLGIAVGPMLAIGAGRASGWRSFYWVTGVLALVAAVVARYVLRESRAARPRRIDVTGVVLLSSGLTALLIGVTGGRTGWLRTATVVPIVIAAVLFAAFALNEARTREPMIDLRLFTRTPFLLSTFGALFTGIAVIGPMTFLPTALQRGSGLSATETATLASGWAFTMFVVALAGRRLRTSTHGGWELAAGFALASVGSLLTYGELDHSWGWLFPGLIVAGVGGGLINSTLPRLAVQTVPAERAAMGSGANNTARYIGSALGVAIVASLAAADPGEALLVATVLGLVSSVAVFALAVRAPAALHPVG
jgi:MFS family permease